MIDVNVFVFENLFSHGFAMSQPARGARRHRFRVHFRLSQG